MDVSLLVVVVIITALAFDFTNGFHDTANAMATTIATKALTPKVAVTVAAILNIVGAFLSTNVATTISSGLVDDSKITPAVIFGGLCGAILWNLFTWLLGLPSSSSHALFGGLIGATWIAGGASAVNFSTVFSKVLIPAFTSPVVAGTVALVATYLAYTITRRVRRPVADRGYRRGQVFSGSLVALAHGTGDAQKTMGVITLVLITAGHLPEGSKPPTWVILSAGLAIGLGTYSGGWRIIRTMGHGLTNVQSPQGFAAETSSSAVLLASAHLGFALSTTQVVSGSVLGSGLGRRLANVHWNTAGRMALAWLVTLPCAGIVGAFSGKIADTGNLGILVVLAALIGMVGLIYGLSRRNPVTAENVNDVEEAPVVLEPVRAA